MKEPRKPWCAYEVRRSPKAPIDQIQIRDADGNVLFVSANYGEHAGAPLTDETKRLAAKMVIDAVNGEQA